MEINRDLLEQFRNSESRLVAVTKYLEKDDTDEVVSKLEEEYLDILE
jgi:hypothetical protein